MWTLGRAADRAAPTRTRPLLRRLSLFLVALACLAAVAAAPARVPLPPGGKVVAKIRIPQGPGGLAVGEGAVWAASEDASILSRIDAARNRVVARIEVAHRKPCPGFPQSCGEAIAGNGALWLSRASENTVLRIDPQTNRVVATIQVGLKPSAIASSSGAVWVVNRGDLSQETKALVPPTLSRIDPATNEVVATIRLGPAAACCSDHMSVTVGAGAVWAGVPNLGAVLRVDPATNKVVARIRLSAPACGQLAADARAVWAAGGFATGCAGFVARVDPRTNRPVGSVKGEMGPIGLALGFGSLWVADLASKSIDRVNLRSGRIVARLPVGGIPIRLGVGFGSVWVRDDSGRVLRISPTGARS